MIKSIENRFKVDRFYRVRSFLMEQFVIAQEKNENISLRSFSRILGLSPGSLSLFFRQSRGLSKKDFQKIAKKFNFSSQEIHFFEPPEFKEPDSTLYKVLKIEDSENLWELMLLLPFIKYHKSLNALANAFEKYGVKKESVEKIIKLLHSEDIIAVSEFGTYEIKQDLGSVKISHQYEDSGQIHKVGLNALDILKKQISDGPLDRFYAQTIVPLSPKEFNDIKLKINILREELLSDIVIKERSEEDIRPYIFQTSFFPIK